MHRLLSFVTSDDNTDVPSNGCMWHGQHAEADDDNYQETLGRE